MNLISPVRVALTLMLLGAGCDAGSRCPAEYPVERDGFCYAPDGGQEPDAPALDGGEGDGGAIEADGGADGGGEPSDGGGVATDAPVLCSGTHPLLDGSRRYCALGDCYCADPDACFPADTADACCPGEIVCGDADGGVGTDGGSVICTGTHPLVDGSRRYCEAGDCYCADPDACFPADTADACCPGAVACE